MSDKNINQPVDDNNVENPEVNTAENPTSPESLLEIQNKVKANLIETLGGETNEYNNELSSLVNQEKALIGKILPFFKSLSQDEQDSYFQDLSSPIKLPNGVDASDELISDLGELLEVRAKFESSLDSMLEVINKVAQDIKLQDFKRQQLSQLATSLNFTLEEGMVLQSKKFNVEFEILDITATHQEINIENQEKLDFNIGNIKFPQVSITLNKNSENQESEKLTINLNQFKNLVEDHELETKIDSLEDLEKMIGFKKYGQTLSTNTKLHALDSENQEIELDILEIEESAQNIILSSPVKINGKETSKLNYRQFIAFFIQYRVEQNFDLSEAKNFVSRFVASKANTAHSMEDFELKNGDIVQIGTSFYLLNNFQNNSLTMNLVEGPYQLEPIKASQERSYSRIIYHLKHSDFTYEYNLTDTQSGSIDHSEAEPLTDEKINAMTADKDKIPSKNAFMEIDWYEVYNALPTPGEFLQGFFSQFNFVSLKSYADAVVVVKESITKRMDRKQTLKTNELLEKLSYSKAKSKAQREIAGEISSAASEYKEQLENTYDVSDFIARLYAPNFGSDIEDRFKFKALVDILAEKGLMRFESHKLAVVINRLLDNFGKGEFKGVLDKKDNTYKSPSGELKGQSWATWALGQIYGSSTANSWESQNSSAYNSARNEGSAVVGRKINSGEDALKDLHKYLVKISNNDYEDVPVPAYLMGMIDSLFDNKMVPVELKIFYFFSFSAIEYHGEPILPKDYFATTEDYGKVPYILHFFNANQIDSGSLQNTKKMQELLKEFQFQFNSEISQPFARFDFAKFRKFLFENLAISQGTNEDSADQNIVQDGAVSKVAPNALHLLAPRYSREVVEKQVIGVGNQYANPLPKINQQKILFGYSQGFESAIAKANNDDDNDGVVRYAFKKMVPGYFALSTYVSGTNYLSMGRGNAEFDESDFDFKDDKIEKDTPLSHHMNACNDFIKNILRHYKDANLVLPINGQMRPIKETDIDIWLTQTSSKEHASKFSNPKSHDDFMASFYRVFEKISNQPDFVDVVKNIPHNLGYQTLPA
jgi:ribosomal protein S17